VAASSEDYNCQLENLAKVSHGLGMDDSGMIWRTHRSQSEYPVSIVIRLDLRSKLSNLFISGADILCALPPSIAVYAADLESQTPDYRLVADLQGLALKKEVQIPMLSVVATHV
jgi:allantoicase